MGSLRPLNGKPYACTGTTTTPGARDDFCAPTAPAIDDKSLSILASTLVELTEFYELETCPGRASWLSEIIEEFEALIAQLDPSHSSELLTP